MNNICSKVYYEIATGKILVVTSEMQGDIKATTKEDDMKVYPQLKNENAGDIDFIELEYGTLVATLNNAKSYKVNLDTKKLEVVYYTKEELDSMQNQSENNQESDNNISDIYQYLIDNPKAIADVEDLILQTEQNKILNGGM